MVWVKIGYMCVPKARMPWLKDQSHVECHVTSLTVLIDMLCDHDGDLSGAQNACYEKSVTCNHGADICRNGTTATLDVRGAIRLDPAPRAFGYFGSLRVCGMTPPPNQQQGVDCDATDKLAVVLRLAAPALSTASLTWLF